MLSARFLRGEGGGRGRGGGTEPRVNEISVALRLSRRDDSESAIAQSEVASVYARHNKQLLYVMAAYGTGAPGVIQG